MFFKKHKNLIPLVLMGICCIYTVLNFLLNRTEADGVIYSYQLSILNYLAFIITPLNFICYFFWRKYFKITTIITLLIGILGFLNYLPAYFLISIIIPIQIFPFMMALLYLGLNYQSISKSNINDEEIDVPRLAKLRERYIHLSTEELMDIREDKRFSKESKIAVSEELMNRQAK